MAFAKKSIAKRRLMEAQGGGGGGGGEVRRLHIIYFLSRKGCIEHPHLIRVHHLSRNGVHLRDVKRWLSELRGKYLAESFAWSYKRRYKTGFVWQDLLDDDLITPISDNEYVLKGSEISPTFNNDLYSYDEMEVPIQKELPLDQDEPNEQKLSSKKIIQEPPQTPMDFLTKTSSEIEEESPLFGSETSTLTDDYTKHEEENHSNTSIEDDQIDQLENTSLHSTLLNKNNSRNDSDNKFISEKASTTASAAKSSSFAKSKSYSNGASNMLRNFITCGAVDTNDSAVVKINRRSKNSMSMYKNKPNGDITAIRRDEKFGGSERIYGSVLKQQQYGGRKSWDGVRGLKEKKKSEFSNQKTVPAAYKPVNGPNCSQCGKQFKPEKLYTHMKSCKGMKAVAKATTNPPASADKPPQSTHPRTHILAIN